MGISHRQGILLHETNCDGTGVGMQWVGLTNGGGVSGHAGLQVLVPHQTRRAGDYKRFACIVALDEAGGIRVGEVVMSRSKILHRAGVSYILLSWNSKKEWMLRPAQPESFD